MTGLATPAHRVVVYGTLKQGLPNHGYLRDAIFLGEDILSQITLYDLGYFPGAKLEVSMGIQVEVFDINSETLQRLDWLEGYYPDQPERSFYQRITLATRYGEAWVYLYAHGVEDLPVIRRGGWEA
jgi:gamma-glutamylcyclotransferase (GGCT)/AIG2-like uncharacterized protein YtfP